jgi:hypothetical protein
MIPPTLYHEETGTITITSDLSFKVARLTALQDRREQAIAVGQDIARYKGDVPVQVLYEHRARRLA